MTWTCDQIEALISDYVEGLLPSSDRAAFEEHVHSCTECAPLLASVKSLMTELHSMEEVELPPRLVYSILDQTLGPREKVTFWQAIQNFVRSLATPRFAYGSASVMATFFILMSASGISLRKPKLADLHPANIYRSADRRLHLIKANGVKYFSDLRVVYEIQSRLRQGENEPLVTPEENQQKSSPDKQPGQNDDHTHVQPKQQNRANELARQMELLAAECPIVLRRSFR